MHRDPGDVSLDMGLSEETAQAGIACAFLISADFRPGREDQYSTTKYVLKTVLQNTARRPVSRNIDMTRA